MNIYIYIHTYTTGELHKLTGLSLLGNPLQFPPKHIQKRGTKVLDQSNQGELFITDYVLQIVLQYLRGTLNEGYISDGSLVD